jgi:uncharacterized membrane protein YeaQ/YmgE (transglycosylase-associated protein family)
MIGTIIWFIVIGLIAGALARLLVPGRDPMGIVATIVLGVIGSFVGGTLWALLTVGRLTLTNASWLGSIIGAIIVLLIWRAIRAKRVA